MEKIKKKTGRTTRLKAHRRGAPQGPRKAKQRREALLESAARLLVEKGYESTTMDEIAADAGFAKGTLYHYFSNKAELLFSLRGEFDRKIAQRIRSNMEKRPADGWRGRIKAWIVGAVEAYFAMSELHDVVIYSSGMPFRNAMAESEVTRQLARLIEDGARAGAWDVDDSRWIAVMMFYSFRGGCDEAMVGAQPAEDLPDRLYSLFLRMLGIGEASDSPA
jgi:AcrR family transcriptional regulator